MGNFDSKKVFDKQLFLRNEKIPSANREFVLGCKLFNLVIGLVVVDSVVKI